VIEDLLAQARQVEIGVGEREQMQRREWETLRTIDRLEHELEAARTRLHITPAAVIR
jgi:hypothetical protein